MTDKLGQLFGIEGSGPRDATLNAIDKAMGIKGARVAEAEPRQMELGETIEGEVIDVQFDQDKQVSYIVETDRGERVKVPQPVDLEFEKGDTIEATRTDTGYEVSADDRGMGL